MTQHHQAGAERSTYEQVMADPVMREAFLTPTPAVLRGHPDDPDHQWAEAVLHVAGVPALISSGYNVFQTQPELLLNGHKHTGLDEIVTAVAAHKA